MNPYMTDAQPDLECARDDLVLLKGARDNIIPFIDLVEIMSQAMNSNVDEVLAFHSAIKAAVADHIAPAIKQCEDAIAEAASIEELKHEEHQRLAHLAGLL